MPAEMPVQPRQKAAAPEKRLFPYATSWPTFNCMAAAEATGGRGTSFTPCTGSNASENLAEQWPHSQKKIVLLAGGFASNL